MRKMFDNVNKDKQITKLKAEIKDLQEWIDCMIDLNDSMEAENERLNAMVSGGYANLPTPTIKGKRPGK